MANIVIGNTTKEISNKLFIQSRPDNIDPGYLYTEIFGTFPIYRCDFDVNRIDEDEDIDIYTVIFDNLMASGEFTAIAYEYGNTNDAEDDYMPSVDKSENSGSNKIYTHRFLVVSNSEPVVIYYQYGDLTVMSHLGKDVIKSYIDKYIRKYDQKDDRAKCYIIVKESGMYLNSFYVKLHNELDFDMYNDGFEDVHNDIVKSINNDENGLYLFYGSPGTGKTTYIRHLIKQCGTIKKKFVYVPSNLFMDFTNPGFLPFLLENRGCVFVIEDCESLVTTTNMGIRSEAIANLLNMTDGLLNDALDIKIICTFNIDDGKIDEALLRPGRCRCKYEFNLLDKDKANKVAKKYGLKEVDKDVSLSKLFNPEKEFHDGKKKKMGFSV